MDRLYAELQSVKLFVYDLSHLFNFNISALAPGALACSQCLGSSTGKVFDGQASADLCNYGYGSLLPLAETHPLRGLAWSGNDGDSDIYHVFHRLLESSLRVSDPLEANVFFIAAPFYQIRHKPYPRYEPCGLRHNAGNWTAFMDWLGEQPAFVRSGGRDHFVFLTKPYVWSRKGAPFVGTGPWAEHPVHAALMANVVKATHWGVEPKERAVAMPFSTFVHAHAGANLTALLDRLFAKQRRHLVSYIGGMWRGGRRGPYALKQQNWDVKRRVGILCWQTPACKALFTDAPPDRESAAAVGAGMRSQHTLPACGNASMPSRVVRAWAGLSEEQRECAYPQLTYLDSVFCLTPPGDAPSRRGLFDALVMGCIPVIFERLTALYPWLWSDSGLERIAVVVDPALLRTKGAVMAVLDGISEPQRAAMRAAIRGIWPLLQYAYDGGVAGSLDAVDLLLARIRNPGLPPVLQ